MIKGRSTANELRVDGRALCLWAAVLIAPVWMFGQQAVPLPAAPATSKAVLQRFAFASDGPTGPGWSRPDEIARSYVHEDLPALFSRTVTFDAAMPARTKLDWIFTGPHAGMTVELTSSRVRVFERYYDSMGLYSAGNYPEKIVRDDERAYTGDARTLTVVVDAHLSVRVLLNGETLLVQPLTFDLTRHQLMFSGPRAEHMPVLCWPSRLPMRPSR
jgi:hypothetical protein